ncbi:hypothetical protein [Legionella brunensis]|uniref:Uncharacterized protein n=1 Tax=Legionella brunensis TaxID=29422 RepID=A0A0W0SU61_9GAMM|nr:hypothetical protein [Legionella brunensis]KTC86817.1 hypothetical protein Lbru_0758 [Legionella brunensis]
MKTVDEESVKAICGESKEVVVYGFGNFNYLEICEAINALSGMKAYNSEDYDYSMEVFDKRQTMGQYDHFKYLLNALVLENYKKQQNGQPITPLFFVVGLDKKSYDLARISARAPDPFEKGVTLTELRRCYKLAHEFGDKLNEVAQQTFKFVKATSTPNGYVLEVVDPFWEEKEWQQQWTTRKQSTKSLPGSVNKNNFWRENYRNLIDKATTKEEENETLDQNQSDQTNP